MRFTKQRISLKKAGKIHPIFPGISSLLYTRVKIELILLVSLNKFLAL